MIYNYTAVLSGVYALKSNIKMTKKYQLHKLITRCENLSVFIALSDNRSNDKKGLHLLLRSLHFKKKTFEG